MGIIKRQGIQSSILVYVGFALGAFNMLFLFPNFFSEEELGLTRVLFSAAITFSQLCLLGIPATMLKFFPFYQEYTGKKNDLLFLSLVGALIGFVTVFFLTYFFHDKLINFYNKKSPLFSDYFFLVYVFGFLLLSYSVLEAYSRTHYRNVLPVFLRELGIRIYTTLIILIFIAGWIDTATFIYLFCIYHFFAALIMLFYLWKRNLLHTTRKISHVTRRVKGKIVSYGVFLYSGGLFQIIAENIDTFLIAGISGLKSTAVFSIASYIGTVVEIPKRSFNSVVTPILSKAWKNNDMKNIREIYEKTALNQLIAGLGLFLLIWFNLDSLFSLLPPAYSEGRYVILVLCIAKVIDLGTGVNGEIVITSNHWKFNFFTSISLVILSIPTNILLITQYGIIGSAYSHLMVFSLFNIIRMIFIYQKFGMQPYSYKMVQVMAFFLFAATVAFFLPFFNSPFIDIPFRSVILAVLFGVPLIMFKTSEDINKLFFQVIHKISRK